MSASYFPPIISSIYLEELAGQATDAKDSALVALNAAEAARDTALEYRNDAQTYYTQVQQIQEGDYVTNLSLEERLGAFNFADLQGIPATFAPSAHGHSWSEIANKPTMYPPTAHGHAWSEITGKPSEFEPAPHIHTWQQIAQKPGTFPPETHFHSWNEIENKPNVFNPAAHTHSWGDISGKPTKFVPAAHTHSWDLIENKPLTFPPQSHHHHWSQVTNKPEQATRWPHFSEVTNKPVQATRWPNYSEVTNKPTLGTAAAKNVGVNEGDLMAVGSFGVGKSLLGDIGGVDIDTLFTSGFYAGVVKNSSGDFPLGVSIGSSNVYNLNVYVRDGNFVVQEMFLTRGVLRGGKWVRAYDGTLGGWSEWQEFYHSGNTNFNEFGGVRPGSSWVAQGFVRLPNTVRFIFPISSTKVASSFSFNGTASDLAVFVPSSGVSVDLTGSTLVQVTFDSNKLAIIEIRNAPTLPEGVQVYLSVDNGKKITFNF